jgi:DNA-binding beta-propeller fold protein YncE
MRPAELILIPIIAGLVLAQAQAQPSTAYHITHRYPLGGDGGWDYIVPDPPRHRLFVARQNRVMVVDEDKGTLLGEVTGIQGAHGTAIAETNGHGFATSGNDQSVVMFDLSTLKPLGRIHAAEDADAIIYDRASNRVFSLNGDAHSSTVIDSQGTLVTNIPLGGKPEYGAAAGDGKVYANLTDTNEVVEIDGASAAVTRRWSTLPCKQPVSMAIDAAHRRLFSGCRSQVLAVSDYQAGKIVATVPIGAGVDGAAYDPDSGDVFASNADGTLTVIHQNSPDTYAVSGVVQTPQGSRNMGLDPVSHRIYVAAARFGPVPAGGRRGPVLPGTFEVLVIERAR